MMPRFYLKHFKQTRFFIVVVMYSVSVTYMT